MMYIVTIIIQLFVYVWWQVYIIENFKGIVCVLFMCTYKMKKGVSFNSLIDNLKMLKYRYELCV